jgi:hypothetical protein
MVYIKTYLSQLQIALSGIEKNFNVELSAKGLIIKLQVKLGIDLAAVSAAQIIVYTALAAQAASKATFSVVKLSADTASLNAKVSSEDNGTITKSSVNALKLISAAACEMEKVNAATMDLSVQAAQLSNISIESAMQLRLTFNAAMALNNAVLNINKFAALITEKNRNNPLISALLANDVSTSAADATVAMAHVLAALQTSTVVAQSVI